MPAGKRESLGHWQHRYLWLYGPLGLTIVGLLMILLPILTNQSSPTDVAFVTNGTLMLIAGVVIPRLKGRMKVGPEGIEGDLLSPTEFAIRGPAVQHSDPDAERPGETTSYVVVPVAPPQTGVPLTSSTVRAGHGAKAYPDGRAHNEERGQTTIGELYEALSLRGWLSAQSGYHVVFRSPDGSRQIVLPGNLGELATPVLVKAVDAEMRANE